MKLVSNLCQRLGAIPGVLGAFVVQRGRCLASSLPSKYGPDLLGRIGATLGRMQQVMHASGYEGGSTAFHWEGASLLAWTASEGTLLCLVASPEVKRNLVETHASDVLTELMRLSECRSYAQEAPTRPEHARPVRLT
ncbi:MAG: hypothetical protein QM784_13590 [Polyangiaceae bacterium]